MVTPSTQPDDDKERLIRLLEAQKRLRRAAAEWAEALDGFDVSREAWDLAREGAARTARLPFLENLRPRPSRPLDYEPQALRLVGGADE